MTQVIDRFRSSTWGWLRGTLAGWGTLLLCLVGVGLIIILVKWIANLATTYEVTSDRLILHKGIFSKSIDEIELYRVKDVRIDFTIINQMADIGTITITSSDETTRDAPLIIRDVDHARARRENLRDLVNTARRARGVREFDMVHEDFGEPA
ncbi:PH domain-containing protein [Sphingomonas sp. JC676]|uniref:PH domain-containing protein n=1 Tax=Sphingomonas sp. JC676 TaxID=2768065 RepID=UPI001658676E|nr:PH domain-containing protein [Sphingomonas sp. JC676]MBC9033506.1 PH domain-containing protein [Sphingomonas sp. JC676]